MTSLKNKDPDGLPCPTPNCDSSDGYKIDPKTGWGRCFSCHTNIPPEKANDKVEHKPKAAAPAKRKSPKIEMGDRFVELPDRKISKATCEKFRVWREDGKDFFAAFEDGRHVGTKYRSLDNKRDQRWTGDQGEMFGQHLFPPKSAKYITITEGEYDAMSAYEMMGSRWPVVSVINGTGSAVQDCKNNFEYLNSFPHVVLSFDNDDAGVKASKAVAALPWPAGKLKIMQHRLHKDANEYKIAGASAAYTKEWWDASDYMPDGLKLSGNMWDEIKIQPDQFSIPYPWQNLNKMTYGIRLSEAVLFMSETGVGKTSIFKEIEYNIITNEEVKKKGYGVGILHLEETNRDSGLGLLSIHKSKPYHLPDVEKSDEELKEAFDEVLADNRAIFYDHFGSNRVDAILDKVRHMAALGCKYIFIDHLSIIVSDQNGDERKQLDEISTRLKTLTMELSIAVFCVIHTNREGSARGSAGPEQLANIHMSLHRDKKERDGWRRNVMKIIIEKNRFCGRTGPCLWLSYKPETGRLTELTEAEVDIYEEGKTKPEGEHLW